MKTMKLDPELRKIFENRGWPQAFLPTIDKIPLFRKLWSAGTARFLASDTVQEYLQERTIDCSQRDFDVPVRDGSQIRARLYLPARRRYPESVKKPALLVMFHGGGFCLGGLDTEGILCKILCSEVCIAVLNIEYRLAPEHLFPTGVHDCMDAVSWASQNALRLSCDLSKGFIVGGVSAGATMAAATAHRWKLERRTPSITGSFMSLTILDDVVQVNGKDIHIAPDEYRSKSENAEAPLLNKALCEQLWTIYKRDRASALGNPLLFESFEGLPRTYLQTCGLDPYRDGSLVYQRRVTEAGGEARLDLYEGLPHGFWTVYPELSATTRWLNDSITGAAWLVDSHHGRKFHSKL